MQSEKVALALNSMMVVIAIGELIIGIWSAALCCGAVCGCCKSRPRENAIQYIPARLNYQAAPQQHIVIYPDAAGIKVCTTVQQMPPQKKSTCEFAANSETLGQKLATVFSI